MDAKKYKWMKVSDLVRDDFFISWVVSKNPEAVDFWVSYVKNNPDQVFKIEEAKNWVLKFHTSTQSEDLGVFDTQKIWDKIEVNIVPKVKKLTWIYFSAAASILFIVGIFVIGLNKNQEYSSRVGQQVKIELTQNASVTLNAVSQLKMLDSDKDKVFLKGEAYFEVVPGNTFSVKTSEGEIKVLGTSFNIQSRNGKTTVDCFSGKVKVTDRIGNTEILMPGERIKIGESGLTSEKEIALEGWRTGMIYLQSDLLGDALDELRIYFEVDFEVSTQIRNRRIVGFFTTNNLDSALIQLTTPLNLKFEKLVSGKVLISENL
jgi:ferric-dicitrate binding protein FerR (iron transport regulator)